MKEMRSRIIEEKELTDVIGLNRYVGEDTSILLPQLGLLRKIE